MDTQSVAFTVRRLAPSLGAEIVGLDLRQEIDAPTTAALRDAWHAHLVLVVRGQALEEADQVRFGECFGTLGTVLGNHDAVGRHPSVMFISNIRKDGKPIGRLPDGEMMFHSDQCYVAAPPIGTMLYGMEVPSVGGNTLFADMYAAYEALPADIKAALATARVRQIYDLNASATRRSASLPADAPRYTHPAIRVHPATGRPALYVNRLMTQAIEGWEADRSDALLEYLFEHQEQPQFQYEHVWRAGDVILWDNRCTLHARTDFEPTERRLLRRITVLRDASQGEASRGEASL
jgi:taurine dioxygenase